MAELFNFNTEYGILIYKPCTYAIQPHGLAQHLTNKHPEFLPRKPFTSYTNQKPRKAAREVTDNLLAQYNVINPRDTIIPTPPTSTEPIPGLKLYRGL